MIGIAAGLMLTYVRINSPKWWISFVTLYLVFIIGILIILHIASGGWDELYGKYFLDVLLCPLIMLIIIEMFAFISYLWRLLL